MIDLCSEFLSVECIWRYVLFMSRTHFRVNLHSIVAWMSRNSFLQAGGNSEEEVTSIWLEPRTTSFVNEHSTIWRNWPNDWAVFWVFICTVHLMVYSCHVTYTFQSESTLYSFLNVKELLARSRCKLSRISDFNWTRTLNHLVSKWTLSNLAKLAKWLYVCICPCYRGRSLSDPSRKVRI